MYGSLLYQKISARREGRACWRYCLFILVFFGVCFYLNKKGLSSSYLNNPKIARETPLNGNAIFCRSQTCQYLI